MQDSASLQASSIETCLFGAVEADIVRGPMEDGEEFRVCGASRYFRSSSVALERKTWSCSDPSAAIDGVHTPYSATPHCGV